MESMISVIIPVYNVEMYLDKCLNSITHQLYTNLEIILIDDGSTDNSGIICDNWSQKDSRIKVIHKKNEGAGKARNIGLDNAQGDYVAFVDSDDYISIEMYEKLVNIFNRDESIDIVECDFVTFDKDEVDFKKINDIDEAKYKIYTTEEALGENIKDKKFRQLIWNKLYRRNVIKNIRFPIDKKIDDEFWTYHVLGNAKKLALTNIKCYAYRQQANSVMHSISIDRRMEGLEARYIRHLYLKDNYPSLEYTSYINLCNMAIYLGQFVLRNVDKHEQKNFFLLLNELVKKVNVSNKNKKLEDYKQLTWIYMSKLSLKKTCKIRNCLGIGL